MQKKFIYVTMLALAACHSPSANLEPSVHSAIEGINCPQSESRLYDVVYKSLVDFQEIPKPEQLRETFAKVLKARPNSQIDEKALLDLVNEFYGVVLKTGEQEPQKILEKVTAMEIGDQSTDEAKERQALLRNFENKWKAFEQSQGLECQQPASEAVPPTTAPPTSGTPAAETSTESLDPRLAVALGGRKVLITAYQSCAAAEIPPMESSTPNVKGISRVGTHSDGIGGKRAITDLQAVQETHYYLQNPGLSSACTDIRRNPPIYDYGGKPKTTADATSPLDLFQNAGSGTSVRGIDCSAYVFSAIASGGLKLHPDKKMKAVLVNGISSSMYMNPKDNGMPCFEKVKMGLSGSLQAGDIVAIRGHVLLIDDVGSDPLGINQVRQVADCANLSTDDFDFVVSQSSPSKNGIGMNRYFGPDYLAEQSTMKAGFVQYARQACQAKFQKKDVLMTATNFQIIRHNQQPTCQDKAVALVGESCAQSCGTRLSSAEIR